MSEQQTEQQQEAQEDQFDLRTWVVDIEKQTDVPFEAICRANIRESETAIKEGRATVRAHSLIVDGQVHLIKGLKAAIKQADRKGDSTNVGKLHVELNDRRNILKGAELGKSSARAAIKQAFDIRNAFLTVLKAHWAETTGE